MFKQSKTNSVSLFILVCACWACAVTGQLGSDPAVLHALGDHGDRIADLETFVTRMKTDYEGTIRMVNELKAENLQLKAKLEALENRTDTCCNAGPSVKQFTSTSNPQHVDTTSTISTPYSAANGTATTTTAANTSSASKPSIQTTANATKQMTDSSLTLGTTTVKPTTSKPAPVISTTAAPTTVKTTSIKQTNDTSTLSHSTVKPTAAKPSTINVTPARPSTIKPSTVKMSSTAPMPAQSSTVKPSTMKPSTVKLSSTTPMSTKATTHLPSTAVTQREFTNCDQVRSEFGYSGEKTVDLKIGGHHKQVLCDFDSEGAWLLIQRRRDGSVNFNRKWVEYQNGFGDTSGEFWIGNEVLHDLTSMDTYTLRIDIEDWAQNKKYAQYEHFSVGSQFDNYMLSVGLMDNCNEVLNDLTNTDTYTLRIDIEDWAQNKKYAQYEHFSVGSQFDNYMLSVGSYTGTAGDSFHYPQSQLLSHHRMMFSTPDRDHDHSFMNCAQKLESGWWFNACYSSNLNGPYLGHPYGTRMLGETNGDPTLDGTGVEWYPYRHRQYSLRRATMRIKIASSSVAMMG